MATFTSSSNLLSGLRVCLAQNISSCKLCLKREASNFQAFAVRRRDSGRPRKSRLISLIAATTTVSRLQDLILITTAATTVRNLGVIPQANLARGLYISR